MTIATGPIIQTAWVVEDIESTEQFFTTAFGVPKWTRIPDVPFGPDTCTYRGKPADFTAHVSMAYLGDMQLELIQPVRGESIYTEFLAAGGPGLHHICFETDDIDAAVNAAEAAGVEVVQQGTMADGAMRFAYLDGAAAGVPYVELAQLGDDIRKLYDYIRSQSS